MVFNTVLYEEKTRFALPRMTARRMVGGRYVGACMHAEWHNSGQRWTRHWFSPRLLLKYSVTCDWNTFKIPNATVFSRLPESDLFPCWNRQCCNSPARGRKSPQWGVRGFGVSEQSVLPLTLPRFSYRRSQVLLIAKTEVRLVLKITNQEFFRHTQQKQSSHHRGTKADLVLSHLLSEINQQCISAGKSFAFPLMAKMRVDWLGDAGVLTHAWSMLQWKQSSLWSSTALGSKFTCRLLLWGFKEYNVQMIHPGSGHRVRLSRLMALVSRQWGPCREIKSLVTGCICSLNIAFPMCFQFLLYVQG